MLLDTSCDFRAFVTALAVGARQVLNDLGEKSYRERWLQEHSADPAGESAPIRAERVRP